MTKFEFNLINNTHIHVEAEDVKTAIDVGYMKTKMLDNNIGSFEEWFKKVVSIGVEVNRYGNSSRG